MKSDHFISFLKTITGADSTDSGAKRTITKERNKEIKNAIMVLAAAVIRCDMNYTSDTEVFIDNFIKTRFDSTSTKSYKVVSQHVETGTEPFAKMACTVLVMLATDDSRYNILEFLFGVAGSDDFVNPKEVRCIHRLSKYLKIPDDDFQKLKRHFLASNNPYGVLGLEEGATLTEVKSAYRKHVLKHHPDKSAVKDRNNIDVEKFRVVRQAYELIIKRDFS